MGSIENSNEGADAGAFARRFAQLLVAAGAKSRSAEMYLRLHGLAGAEPCSLRTVQPEISGERVRQLMGELENGALQAVLGASSGELSSLRVGLAQTLRKIETHAPGADMDIRAALARDIDPLDTSPACILRLADKLGVHHSLRLTSWVWRAKFSDPARTKLLTPDEPMRREAIVAIVPDTMPELGEHFFNFARQRSRGLGVVSAEKLADEYGVVSGHPLAAHEALAMLRPFAVGLGRHDGEDWFTFFNSANEFLRKAAARVNGLGQCSFDALRQFHVRNNRSAYAENPEAVPETVLRELLTLAGFELVGDVVKAPARRKASAEPATFAQLELVRLFERVRSSLGGRKSVPRDAMLQALQDAGHRESAAVTFMSDRTLFVSAGRLCRLSDTAEDWLAADATLSV